MSGALALLLAAEAAPILSAGSGDLENSGAGPLAVALAFETDGDRVASITAGSTDEGDWITPKAMAGAVNGLCTVRIHVDSGSIDASSMAVDTDHALSTLRTVSITRLTSGTSAATVTFTLKFNGATMHSVQRTLSVTMT